MPPNQYAALFRIECLHEYFGGGACRSLVLSPTEDCRTLLARYRMLFRAEEGGGSVYAPMQQQPGLLASFDESAPFTFSLTSSDPALNVYTELNDDAAVNPAEELFYFDNRSCRETTAFGKPRLLLHRPGEPLMARSVSVKPKLSNFRPQSAPAGDYVQVMDPLTGLAIQQIPAGPGTPLLLDLCRLPVGHYSLAISGKELQKFYLTDSPASRQWGAISIFLGGKLQSSHLPANCRALNLNGDVSPKTFTIALESRKTLWRYYIIDPAGKQGFANHELEATIKQSNRAHEGAGDIRFVRAPEAASVGTREAWVFESESPLPFLYAPGSDFSVTLRPGENGNRGERSMRLPYAQPSSMVRKEGPKPQPWCSEIFVYV